MTMRPYELDLERLTTVETTKERERTQERLVKPITAIVSHVPLRYSPAGLYTGAERDVLVVASRLDGWRVVPQQMEDAYRLLHVDSCAEIIDSLLPRIDSMAAYLGVEGASPGFDYIREGMRVRGKGDVGLVTCEHDAEVKKQFAAERFVPVLWVDCGKEARVLDEIAADALGGRKYMPAGECYL